MSMTALLCKTETRKKAYLLYYLVALTTRLDKTFNVSLQVSFCYVVTVLMHE